MTPEEFEKASLEWLKRQGSAYPNGHIEHNVLVSTRNGNYQIDGRICFQAYGLPFTIIVECKMYKQSVNREKVIVLLDKVRELGAQKGILVSTAPFQKGAIQFAKNNGITLIRLNANGNDYTAEYITDSSQDFFQGATTLRFPRMLSAAPSDIPRSYIPREQIKQDLLSILYSGNSVLLHSIGGVGKTMLARDIVKTIRQTPSKESGFDAIAWINCAGGSLRDALISSLYETKNICNPSDAWVVACSIMDNYQKQLLIVADNLENLSDDEQEQLNDLPCCILATSRHTRCGALQQYNLPDLNMEECKALFMYHYKGATDLFSLREIIRLADYHAVTVELLAKLANRETVKLSDFLQDLINQGFHIGKETVAADHQDLRKERKILDQISILFTMNRCSSSQTQLLTKLSVLPSIPFQFSSVSKWLELSSRSALEQLVEIGWISSVGDYSPTYQIHSTVAAAIRSQMQPSLYQTCRPIICNLLSEMHLGKHEYLYQKKKYISFAWSISDLLQTHLCDETDAVFLEVVASIFYEIGNLHKAYYLYMRAVQLRRKLKQNNKQLIHSWRSLGDVLIQLSDYPNAEKFLKKALNAANTKPRSLRDIMLTKHSLAYLAVKEGKYQLAAKRFSSAKKFYELEALADSYDKAVFYIDYASFYRDFSVKGNTKKAEIYYQKGISLFENAKLTREPEYAAALCQFGLLYRDKGSFNKALEVERKALKYQKKLLDEQSPDIADTYGTIGLLEYDLDLIDLAEADTMKALSIFQELYSEQHESVATTYNNLGLIYAAVPGFEEKAASMYIKALDIRLNLYNRKPHLKLAESYNNLAMLYRHNGYRKEARDCFDQALAIYDELDVVIEDLATVLDNSANLAMDEQDYERAYEEASLGLSIRNSISLDSYNSSFSHNTLGLYFYGQGLFEKAKYHFEKAVQIKTTALGKHINESLATAHFNLALALEELKDTKASMEYEISEKMYRKLRLTDDADTAKEYRQNIANN